MPFSSRELALHCANLVDQKGGDDVRVLQLPTTAHSFDYAVLVTAQSDRLTNALVEEIWHFCKRHHVPRMPVEGESGWMLIDCYDVVVHALNTEKRAYYQLDTLWAMARDVPWAKEVKLLANPDRPDVPAPAAKKPVRRSKKVVADDADEADDVEVDEAAAPKTKAKAKAKKPAAEVEPAAKVAKPKRPAKKKIADGEVEKIEIPERPAPKKRKLAARAKRPGDAV